MYLVSVYLSEERNAIYLQWFVHYGGGDVLNLFIFFSVFLICSLSKQRLGLIVLHNAAVNVNKFKNAHGHDWTYPSKLVTKSPKKASFHYLTAADLM